MTASKKKGLNLPLSPEKAREYGKKGGIASGKSRRERRAIKDELLLLLGMPVEELEGMTWQRAMLVAMLKKAQAGEVSAATFIRDTIGEKPTDKVQHSGVTAEVQIYKIPDNERD